MHSTGTGKKPLPAKIILLLFIISASFPAAGQDLLVKKLAGSMCPCTSKLPVFSLEGINDCFDKATDEHFDLMMKTCMALYKGTPDQIGYQCGRDMFNKAAEYMMRTCPGFMVKMDSMRFQAYKSPDPGSLGLVLDSINHTDSVAHPSAFHTSKGLVLFSMADYAGARFQFQQLVAADPKSVLGAYFIAWTDEIQGNYDKAIAQYQELATKTGTREFGLYVAIAKVKKDRKPKNK